MAQIVQPQIAVTDPRPVLAALIQAFQQCVPSNAYFLLGPNLYQSIYAQTGGRGCYPLLAAYGTTWNVTILSTVQYPAGPIYTIRTDHPGGSLFWQIGISQWTQRVEYLNVNAAQQQPAPPANPDTTPTITTEKRPAAKVVTTEKPREVDPDEACLVYKNMCPKQ